MDKYIREYGAVIVAVIVAIPLVTLLIFGNTNANLIQKYTKSAETVNLTSNDSSASLSSSISSATTEITYNPTGNDGTHERFKSGTTAYNLNDYFYADTTVIKKLEIVSVYLIETSEQLLNTTNTSDSFTFTTSGHYKIKVKTLNNSNKEYSKEFEISIN